MNRNLAKMPKSWFYPLGFRVGAGHVGVKKDPKLADMAMIVSDRDCTAAGVFTSNAFKAAPVQVDQKILAQSKGSGIRAVVINSGNANAVTGKQGILDAQSMVAAAAKAAGSSNSENGALVMSTGVIGQLLPREKVISGIPKVLESLGDEATNWLEFAKGIMTTDTFPKLVAYQFTVGDKTYNLAGTAKGAGMIAPNMATLLGCLATDASVSADALQQALRSVVDDSFNAISIDGDMSTNDTILALANGAAGGPEITADGPGYAELRDAMASACTDLAQLVVRDGEGATKFITLTVEGATSKEQARQVAGTVARSMLVKTALYGKDANWGRILCAVGYSGVTVDPASTNVSFIPADGSEPLKLLVNGEPEQVDEGRAAQILQDTDVEIQIQLGVGSSSTKYWTCDLSHEYVTINGDYRS